jgi:hypothetical protein
MRHLRSDCTEQSKQVDITPGEKMKFRLVVLVVTLTLLTFSGMILADSVGTDFESFATGPVNGQFGWSCTGPYDVDVVANNSIAPAEFQTQSLRISNGITRGSFGDQTFSAPLLNEAGETNAEPTATGGVRQSHFEAQFSLASFTGALQAGLAMSVSPDNGNGARMSYLRFEDQDNGIHVFFVDVHDPTGICPDSAFAETDIATVDRAAHIFKFVIDFVDGPHNDVVRIYIDDSLKKVGTSWEDYYRYCAESHNTYPTRAVNSLLFREGGVAVIANLGAGFLIDNVSLNSGPGFRDCKNGNWANFSGNPGPFRNQGQCVSYFQSHPQ